MDPYRKYFNIDPGYFPAVDEKVIKNNPDLWKKFYPHETFIKLLKDIEKVLTRQQKLNIWVEGAYGTGKSHAVLTLKHLLDATEEETRAYFEDFEIDKDLCKKFIAAKNQGKILTVHRYGSSSIHGDNDLFLAIQESIEQALKREGFSTEGYESLKESIIKYLSDEENKQSFEIYVKGSYKELFGGDSVEEIVKNLSSYKDLALQELMSKISKVANEKQIKAFTLDDEGLVNWVEEVINKNKLSALVFIWDEFSEYFYNNKHHLTGFQRLLQLSESAPFCFIPVTHKSGELFADTDSDKKKTLDRFIRPTCTIQLPENMAFRLMGQALKKSEDEVLKNEWDEILLDLDNRTNDSRKIIKESAKLADEDLQRILPIHPYAASLLKHIATSFESNQRSMFEFIKDDKGEEVKGFQWFIDNVGPFDDNPLLTIDMLWGYFYDMGKDSLAHNIRMILDYYPRLTATKQLDSEEMRVLRTILLFQAISISTNDSIEIFLSNEKNLNNAFEGTDLEHGKASSCAEKLVRDGIIYKKKIKDNKYVYAILTGEIDSNKIDEQKKIYEGKQTTTLIQEGELLDAIELPPALKLRYSIEYAGTTDFELKAKKAISSAQDKEHQHYIYALVAFAKDNNEAAVIKKKIQELIQKNPGNGVIFIDASKTLLGEEKFSEWVEDKATAAYYTGKDNSQSQHYTDYAKAILTDWRERIRTGTFIVYSDSHPTGDTVSSADSLIDMLFEEDKKVFRLGLEALQINHANMWTASALQLGVQCGAEEKVTGTYNTQKRMILENAFNGAWQIPNYWKVSPSNPISRMKLYLNDIIEEKMESEGRISIREIYNGMKEAPIGLMPCNASAFALGFLLKEYLFDGKYSWSDDVSSDELTLDKFKTMIANVIKLENTDDRHYRDNYIVTMTPEQKNFIELTSAAFNIDKKLCSSLENTRERLRSRMKDMGFPIWSLSYILNKTNLKTETEVITELLDLYCGIANNNVSETGKSESDLANEIGKLAIDFPTCIEDLKNLLTKDNCTSGMQSYLGTYNNGELIELAEQIGDGGAYIQALRNKFDADAANWVWKIDTVNQKIDEVVCEYKIMEVTYKIHNVTCKTYSDALYLWSDKCNNMRISYQVIKNEIGELDNLLSLLYLLRKNGNLQESQKPQLLEAMRNYGDNFKVLYSNQQDMFTKVEDFYLGGLTDADISEVFKRINIGAFTKDATDYNQNVEHIVNEYKKTLGTQKLKNMWKKKTGTESPHDWSNKYMMPILAMIPDEEMSDCRKHFATISTKNPDDIKVQQAQIYLDGFKHWDTLNDAEKRDKVFVEKIINDKSVILKDINEVKNYLSSRITDDPYYWFGSTAVQSCLEKLAKSKYDRGGFQAAFNKIDNMDADTVKQYLKDLIKNNMIVGLQIIKDK